MVDRYGAHNEENLETETDPDVCDEENLQMVSKAFGFEDEPEYSDCEHDDSESDSDDCFDLQYFCHNFWGFKCHIK